MRVGRLFTYHGRRYEPGDDFDMGRLPVSKHQTFIRLFGLGERSAPTKKKKKERQRIVDDAQAGIEAAIATALLDKKKADEAAGKPVLKDLIEEPPEGGVQEQ